LSWAGIRPFRCQECEIRFWRIGNQLWLDDDPAPLGFPLFILTSLAARVIDLIHALKDEHEVKSAPKEENREKETP
jgi:hypothetical protein